MNKIKGAEKQQALTHRELRNLTGALLNINNQIASSGLITDLIGKMQLTKENLNLYLLLLKATKSFYTSEDIVNHIRANYNYSKTKPLGKWKKGKPKYHKVLHPEAPYIRHGTKELRESIDKLKESQLLMRIDGGKETDKKTHNKMELVPQLISITYNYKFLRLKWHEPPSPKLPFGSIRVTKPEEVSLSKEDMIRFLENYIFHDGFSLVTQQQIDEINEQIAEASITDLKKTIDGLIYRLGIDKDWLLKIFDVYDFERELGMKIVKN